jgi:hypothetical protein
VKGCKPISSPSLICTATPAFHHSTDRKWIYAKYTTFFDQIFFVSLLILQSSVFNLKILATETNSQMSQNPRIRRIYKLKKLIKIKVNYVFFSS